MSEWLNVIDSWVDSAAGALKAVHSAALLELLTAEDEIADWHKTGAAAPAAPSPARAPSEYPRLMFGEYRPRQEKLGWWDRFQVADGWFAASVRTLAAASIVGAVIVLGANLALRSAPQSEAYAPSAPLPSEHTDDWATPFPPPPVEKTPDETSGPAFAADAVEASSADLATLKPDEPTSAAPSEAAIAPAEQIDEADSPAPEPPEAPAEQY